MADALGSLPAFDGEAASARLVAVHPADCSRVIQVAGERGGQGEVSEERGVGGSVEREGETPRQKARWAEARGKQGVGRRNRERVRRRDGSKQKLGGRWESRW